MIDYIKSIFLKIDSRYLLLVFVGILFFFWPIPHTIAVRYWAILLSVVCAIYVVIKSRTNPFIDADIKPFATILSISTVWFFIQALLISPETSWALKEIGGQWLVGIVSFVLGVAAVFALREPKKIFLLISFIVAVNIAYIDLHGIRAYVNEGNVELRLMGLTEGPDKANYLTNFAFAIVATEIFFRNILNRRILPIDNFVLFGVAVLTLLSAYLETMRFGFIGIMFMVFTLYIFWFFMQSSKTINRTITGFVVVFCLISSIAFVSYKSDTRWESTFDTIPAALDTKTNKAWLNWDKYPRPLLESGEQVNHSNYMRVAWAKEGSILILENPFGVGYGRNAFGHALKAKYGEGGGHSHSGIIDLGIGTGIPGVVLWILFVGGLAFYGAKSFYKYKSYYGLLLCFIAGGYFFRMLVDSTIRDHMLEQFMFLAGMFLALTVKEKNEEDSASQI